MPMKPDNFDKWNEETQAAVRYVWSKQPNASAHGHGYNTYLLIPNPEKSEGKPVAVSLGFEVTMPKAWTWDQCEPLLWKMAAVFLKHQEQIVSA